MKYIVWITLVTMLWAMSPQLVSAVSTGYITVTATGADNLCITVTPDNYSLGITHEYDEATTPYFTITNCAATAAVIRIKATDITGATVTWNLANSPGDAEYALRVYFNSEMESTIGFATESDYTLGFSADSDYTLADSEEELQLTNADQIMYDSLAGSDVREFWLFLQAPWDNIGNESMTGLVTITASLV